ncbi:two-component system, OmpR family, sensor histidine kinase VicK [Burkholderiaceae bacterium]|nr:two-component system, OmpR family, sensor histidine kinase VicK [Burkholderiaceae bacterium]
MDTPRKQEDLVEAEERIRSVVNHVVDGIISIDEHGTVTTFNPAAERIFGYAAEEVIGHNVCMLMPEPDRGQHDDYIHSYLRTGHAKIIGSGREVVGRRKDGGVFPMELAISEFRLGDKRHFTGIVRDITERKRAEQELRLAEERVRSVVDHVIDGIITIDAAGRVESFNPAAEKLFGYRRDEVLGRNVNMLMPPPYHGEHDGYLANYLSTGKPKIIGIGREVVGRRKDGSTFPMELAVSEFHIEHGRYFTGIVRDITQRKELERELHERMAELAEADRQKNDFLAMLAHELRNPLAPMRNSLYLLNSAKSDEASRNRARDILERQMQHIVRLVDDLLDVSRIGRGMIELRREIIDIQEALSRGVETAQPTIEAHGHQLRISLPEAALWIDGDLVRLGQVIANLLTNAAKYTSGPGTIDVTVSRDGDAAVISVRDAGIGIAPEMLPRVFDLFVQADRSLARSQGGLGIGLTLVRRLVALHGGSVSAHSEGLGHGSEFIVRLPAASAPPKRRAATAASLHSTAATGAARQRVLVVDDNVDAADSIVLILQAAGCDVKCAYDGPSALLQAKAYQPDVVVLDIGLPGMSGYEVARQLREQAEFAKTPLVAVTGYGQADDRRRSREAGFDYHMTKPVDPERLKHFIAKPADFHWAKTSARRRTGATPRRTRRP